MQFSDIIGLEETKTTLVNSFKNNHVAHAQMFLGHLGGANLSLALAYATLINCLEPLENDSCGQCSSCKRYKKLIHPDLHFVFPQANTPKLKTHQDFVIAWRDFVSQEPYGTAKDWTSFFEAENKQLNISVAQRRQIISSLSLKALDANYKVLLLWLPEYMQAPAANALLKILEEPPEKTLFLLVSNQLDKLLATIISRCQIVQIPAFSDENVKEYLHQHDIPQQKINEITNIVNGNLSRALQLSKDIQDDNQTWFRDWMRLCFLHDYSTVIEKSEEFHRLGKEAQKNLFSYTLSIFRESLIARFADEKLQRVEESTLEFVKNFSKVITQKNIHVLTELVNEAYYHLERNANARILFTNLSLRMAQAIKAKRV